MIIADFAHWPLMAIRLFAKRGTFLPSPVIPRARYGRTCSVRLKITGKIGRENREQPQAARGSFLAGSTRLRVAEKRQREDRTAAMGENVAEVYVREWRKREQQLWEL